MTFPTTTDILWFTILMLGVVILTQWQEKYRKRKERAIK